ncbi:universal stress protein [Ferrovibrio sp.]|uniref:universal stress protein n=1 Tax=Ferrovibrio sp. TaxID=1917215 RepID=UPI003D2A5A4F
MGYQDILLHLSDDPRSAVKTDVALRLAQKFNAHLIGLYTVPPPVVPYYSGEFVPAAFIQQQVDESLAAAAKAQAAFEAATAREGVAAEWIVTEGPPIEAAASAARAVDLVVLGQPDPSPAESPVPSPAVGLLPHDIALSAGRPVLVLPYAGKFPSIGKRVMIAWSGTKEATRAVHDAMPFLKTAEKVTVLSINADKSRGTPGASLARHLARHGVTVELANTVADDISVGEALLSTIADREVDLLVMGAYGHSRLREMVFGGVTETILDAMTVPVLLSN